MILVSAATAFLLPRLLPPLALATSFADDLLLTRFAHPEAQHSRIVVIGLTERTLASLACRSPIDRRYLAGLIDRLAAAGATAVGLDVLLDAPTLPDADALLRDRLLHSPVPVVAIDAHEATGLGEAQRAHLSAYLDGVDKGYANLVKRRIDGTVRLHEPRLPSGEASFPARLARRLGVTPPATTFEIAWHGRPDAATTPFPIYPAEVVPLLPREWLAGKVALIGVTVGDADRHRTPLSVAGGSTAGVEIQAHVLAQMLDGRRHPRLAPAGEAALLLGLATLGSLAATLVLPFPLVPLLVLAGLGAYAAATVLALGGLGILLPLVPGNLAAAASLSTTTGLALWRERQERRALMGIFARHVSPPVAAELWRQRAAFMAGGRPRPQELTATVLFSDVAGFTGIAERLPPAALMDWLEGYLERMVAIVTDGRGLVLRFIGDALLAVYGVPVARTSEAEIAADARAAADGALAMADAVARLNDDLAARGLPPVAIRIGLHTGTLIAGSVGASSHLEYSLVGDTANIAARLEAYAKTLRGPASGSPCTIIVGDATARLLGPGYRLHPVGELALRGKQQAVAAFELLPARRHDDRREPEPPARAGGESREGDDQGRRPRSAMPTGPVLEERG